jgi:thioredoxin 1
MENKPTFNDLIQGEIPVLVDFSAEWCGPCQMLAPELKKLAEMSEDKMKIIKIDIDRNQQLSATFRVQSVPTMILFRKGEMLWRNSGYMTAQQLHQILDKFLG